MRGAGFQHLGHFQHLGNLANAGVHAAFIHPSIAQRKGQIVVDRHRVVDHRKLKHLRDVALIGRQIGHVAIIKQDAPLGRMQKARNDVEKRGFATTGRAKQRIGTTVLPIQIDLLERIVRRAFGIGRVGMAQVGQGYFGHHRKSALNGTVEAAFALPSQTKGRDVCCDFNWMHIRQQAFHQGQSKNSARHPYKRRDPHQPCRDERHGPAIPNHPRPSENARWIPSPRVR
mmetsp:Transcript_22321/g.35628  ORF Transcript_22321/g.35628 Transcript_22321/m.35628 type:complete len:229 (-) Transcript_22321:1213-1899(-)